jgi:hypothetical protein
MTPAQAQDVLEGCRMAIFVAQSLAVRADRPGAGLDGADPAHVRDALREITALLPVADPRIDEDLRDGTAALTEATDLAETAERDGLGRRERRRLAALHRSGTERLSNALVRLGDLADLGALHI